MKANLKTISIKMNTEGYRLTSLFPIRLKAFCIYFSKEQKAKKQNFIVVISLESVWIKLAFVN